MPLHVDYRPDSLEDVVGNATTVKALERMLGREDKNHTMLFVGDSGCGKTTLAYIAAKTLLGIDSVDALATCRDFKEINSSDFSGKDTVREIRSQMIFRPAVADCRVFFLDECHKLTPDAQEAFLKYTENPPSHVYFIFATTEPGKLKSTFKRRAATFEVKPLKEAEVISYLKEVSGNEDLDMSEEGFELIAENSFGSLGIALEALDRCIGADEEEMEELVTAAAESKEEAIALAKLLMSDRTSWKDVAKVLKKFKDEGKEPEGIRRLLLAWAQGSLLGKGGYSERAHNILHYFKEPTYDMGFPAIVLGCCDILMEE